MIESKTHLYQCNLPLEGKTWRRGFGEDDPNTMYPYGSYVCVQPIEMGRHEKIATEPTSEEMLTTWKGLQGLERVSVLTEGNQHLHGSWPKTMNIWTTTLWDSKNHRLLQGLTAWVPRLEEPQTQSPERQTQYIKKGPYCQLHLLTGWSYYIFFPHCCWLNNLFVRWI